MLALYQPFKSDISGQVLFYYTRKPWTQGDQVAPSSLKTNSDFCLNFWAGESHTNVRGVWQISNLGDT